MRQICNAGGLGKLMHAVAGTVAHESAMRGGELNKIPRFKL